MSSDDLNDEMAQASTAVFLQIGIDAARAQLHTGQPSSPVCEGCLAPIPLARQRAIPGVTLCVGCQDVKECCERHYAGHRGGHHAR